MAVLQMQKLCICALKKDRKSLMEFLQAAGVLELTAEAEPDEIFKRTDTLEDRQKFERNAATADRALEVLAAVVPEETSMLAGLAGKPLAKAGAYRETEANAEALLGQAERILNLQKQITEEKTAALRLLAEAESLKPWQKLEIPLAYQETKRCAILVGAVGGGAYTQEEIYASVAKQEPQLEKWELEVVGSDADQTCIAVICLKEDEEKLETALRSIGFARPARPVEEVPAAYAKKLKAQAAEHEGRAAATEEELKQCAPAREDLKLLSDYYRLRAQKYEALGEILQSEKTCMITGFIPKRDAKGLEEKLNSRFELAVESSDVPEDEEAPVIWRGPVIAGTVKQFWSDVVWGDLDYLFVDMPPGTGDVPLTVFQSLPVDGIVIVTSPQELVQMIVKKAYNMAGMMNIPVLGVVENYSYLKCPDCGKEIKLFGESHIDEVASELAMQVLGKMPLDPAYAELADQGLFYKADNPYLEDAVKKIENM